MMPSSFGTSVRIWDLPTRVFHVVLIACVAGLIITGEIGGDIMTLHFYFGYAVLTLVLFRMAWGIVGGHWSRFIHFIPTPAQMRAYIAAMRQLHAKPTAGHNPLGAVSVLVMLVVLLAQVFSGFLSDDEVSVTGPWATWAPSAWIELASEYHTETGKALLITLVVLHIGAVLFHKYVKGDDLISPMVSGDKVLPEDLAHTTPASADTWVTRTKAVLVLALCAYAVYRVVNLTLTV